MEEREVKVAQKSKLLQRPGDAKQKYRIDNDNLYTRRSNKKYYTHISISFNQHNSLAVHLASQSIQGEKEPQEIQKRKNKEQGKREEREAEGNSKYYTILSSPSHSSPPPRHARAHASEIRSRAPPVMAAMDAPAGRPRAKTRAAVEKAAA